MPAYQARNAATAEAPRKTSGPAKLFLCAEGQGSVEQEAWKSNASARHPRGQIATEVRLPRLELNDFLLARLVWNWRLDASSCNEVHKGTGRSSRIIYLRSLAAAAPERPSSALLVIRRGDFLAA